MSNKFSQHEKNKFKDRLNRLSKEPVLFIEKIIGCDSLEEYHKRICEAVIEYDKLNIKACHAVGKTFILGKLVPWFISTHKNSIVITTAPTNRQVEKLLWGEIRKTVRRSKTHLGGKLLSKEWKIDEDWYALGFSPSTKDGNSAEGQQSSSFQGFHAKHVMIIFDEATGITKDMYTMAEGLVTSGMTVKWICIANPTSTSCEFFQTTKQADWHTMTINLFDSPNLIANGITDMDKLKRELEYLRTLDDAERLQRIKNYKKPNHYLITAQWSIAKLFTWGLNSPLSRSKILGHFPEANDDVIISFDNLQMAINRYQNNEEDSEYEKRYIALDPARYGEDLSVYTEIRDNRFHQKQAWPKQELSETQGQVLRLFWEGDEGKETHIGIDTVGLGAGVYSNLLDLKRSGDLPKYVHIHEIVAGSNIDLGTDKDNEEANKYHENVKAYMYDKFNQDCRDFLQIPDEEIYQTESCDIKFKYHGKTGKLLVESKDDYKKRKSKSPDHTDSITMCNFLRYLKPKYTSFIGISSKPTTRKTVSEVRNRQGSRIKIRE